MYNAKDEQSEKRSCKMEKEEQSEKSSSIMEKEEQSEKLHDGK